jgi:hypothetical protein
MAQLTERKDEKKLTRADVAKKLEASRERDNELVTGIFDYIEHKKGTLRFRFKKYAQDEFKAYELRDGEKYKLPRMVARHLNNNVHYLEYKALNSLTDDNGRPMSAGFNDGSLTCPERMQVTTKVHRCAFRSLEFMDDDLSPSGLVEVTHRL